LIVGMELPMGIALILYAGTYRVVISMFIRPQMLYTENSVLAGHAGVMEEYSGMIEKNGMVVDLKKTGMR
jgi:hypothetical protein